MEKYLSNDTEKALSNLINHIKEDDDYKNCLRLKKVMNDDKDLTKIINEVKSLQKKYIRSNYDKVIKEKLKEKENLLNSNTTFIEYNYYLDKINSKIDMIKNELNDYFQSVVDYSFDE